MIIILLLFLWATPALLDSPACESNETYDFCGTYCPATCQIPYPSNNCPEVCVIGCFCNEGYVRENLGGKCILIEDCQGVCRDNEKYDTCGTRCPATCTNPFPSCEKNCSQGCFCTEGFILEDATQTCVKKVDCPQK